MSKNPVKHRGRDAKGGSKRHSLCSPIRLFGFGLFTFIAGNIVLFYFLRAHVSEDTSSHFANFKSERVQQAMGYEKGFFGKGMRGFLGKSTPNDDDDDDDESKLFSHVSNGHPDEVSTTTSDIERAHDPSSMIVIDSSHEQQHDQSIQVFNEGYLAWRSPPKDIEALFVGTKETLSIRAGSLILGKLSDGGNELNVVHPFEKNIIFPTDLKQEHFPVQKRSVCSLPSSTSKFLIGVDFPGGDLPHQGSNQAIDATACCKQCEQIQACTIWTFIGDTGECWLKHDPARKIEEEENGVTHNFVLGMPPPGMKVKSAQPEKKPIIPKANRKTTSGQFKRIGKGGKSVDNIGNVHFIPRLSDDPYILKRSNPDIDWISQWPIGTGKMGALVGGNAQHEIISMSISGFYVAQVSHQPKFDDKALGKRVDDFHSAREALRRGDFAASHGNISKLADGGLGAFQYVADIVLKYSGSQLTSTSLSTTPGRRLGKISVKSNQNMNIKPQSRKPPPLPPEKPPSRHTLISHIDELHDEIDKSNDESQKGMLGDSTMDLMNGIVSSVFVEKNTGDMERAKVTTREYFASSVDQVMVTEMHCKLNEDTPGGNNKTKYDGCLNVAAQMVRQSSTDLHLPATAEISKYNVARSSVEEERYTDISYSVDLKVGGDTNGIQAPNTHLCAVYTCSAWKKREDLSLFGFIEAKKEVTEDKSLICNSADRLQIVVSTASFQDHLTDSVDNITPEKMVMISDQVKEVCWMRLRGAVDMGIPEIRQRHITDFGKKMSATQLNIFPSPQQKSVSHLSPYTFQRPTVTQLYQHSKYLMLSSSRYSVPNLQGLWADGPQAPWNGDYHMNINIEQAYWATGAVGFRENYGPLIKFVKRLADGKGHKTYSSTDKNHVIFQDTAHSMYGCRGWVAHGFMDPLSMNAGLLGEAQWGLCITCGAWLALTLWEALLYEQKDDGIYNNDTILAILKIYRGIVIFFSEYMFEDVATGMYHTGPTTSPENSYLLREKNPTNSTRRHLTATKKVSQHQMMKSKPKAKPLSTNNAQVLAFSPAIDMSVLKQVANIFSILVNLVNSTVDSSQYTSFVDDTELSSNFDSMVKRMPGQGNPVVSDFSGLVLEYPNPLPGVATPLTSKETLLSEINVHKTVHEDMDVGHRHFSSMHWVYPATFSSFDDETMLIGRESSLATAAISTMDKKVQNGGGHTSWSATWAACLYARLRQGPKAQEMIDRVIDRFTTSNLWSLHPPLKPIDSPGTRGCTTCFHETVPATTSLSNIADKNRGLLTADNSKVQLDGSWGFLAAVNEMLIQSHTPGVLELLPALSKDMSRQGELLGFVSRGNVKIDLNWAYGSVQQANFEFLGVHFWNSGNIVKKDGKDGYFEYTTNREGNEDNSKSGSVDNNTNVSNLSIVSPNSLELNAPPSCVLKSSWGPDYEMTYESRKIVQLKIISYPCRFILTGR